MGRIAALAEQHYQKYLPQTYQGLEDKEAFFQNLETEAEAQIDELTDRFSEEETPSPDETFEQKAGRLRSARQRAEELVMRETVLLDPATVETEDQEQETGYPPSLDPLTPPEPATPEDRQLASAMTDFQDATAEWNEQRRSQQPTSPPQSPSPSDPTTPERPPTE